MDIDNLIERLINLTYRDKGDKYDFSVISERHRDAVSNEINKWALDNCKRMAELEAKVYAYEKIIANSNFAPIISNEKEKHLI